jgi:hypothetical protein
MTCALAIYTGGLHAHAHVMATAALHRKRCSHMHAHNHLSPKTISTYIHEYIHIHIHIQHCTYIYKHVCVHDVHAHTHLPHKYTLPTYIRRMHTYRYRYRYVHACIHTHIYPVFRTRSYTYARGRPHMRVPTRLRTRERASAATLRTTARAAPTTRRARPACGGAPPGPERAAHTKDNVVTAAVFHAPMFALNADADWNACEPNHPRSTADGKALACVGADACAPDRTRAHARARTQHAGACVWRAGIGDPFVGVARRAWL